MSDTAHAPWARQPGFDFLLVGSAAEATDAGTASAATTALDSALHVPDGAVYPHVRDGILSLRGAVSWDFQREAAGSAVAGLPGVRAIVNALTVRCALPAPLPDGRAALTAWTRPQR